MNTDNIPTISSWAKRGIQGAKKFGCEIALKPAIASIATITLFSFLAYRFGSMSIHGGPDSFNLLGVVAFILAMPAAIVCKWIEDWLADYPMWLFWPLCLGPYLVIFYFLWKRFFRWLEPEDISRRS
jgi:hypothetical protein